MTINQSIQETSDSIFSLLSSTSFSISINSSISEIHAMFKSTKIVSIIIDMIIQAPDLMFAKNIYLLFTKFNSFLLEDLVNDHETLHLLFREIFPSNLSSKFSTIYLINILSSAFSLFPSKIFHFLNQSKEYFSSIIKSIGNLHIFTFISDHFCKTAKGFKFITHVFKNLLNQNNNSPKFRNNSFKILIFF